MGSAMPKLDLLMQDAEATRFRTCEYLAEMSKELAQIAFNNDLDTLAIIFDMARQDAERILQTSDEHLSQM
jgi:hypothetical protein